MRLLVVPLLIVAFVAIGCGQPDAGDRFQSQGAAGSPVATTTPDMRATSVPTVDIGMTVEPTEMIQAAIDYSVWREAIVTGTPEAVLAIPGTPESIRQLGLNIGNWDPSCVQPMYLVILKGDFNGHNLFVVPTDGLELRGTYVAYVFDLAHGAPGDVTFTILSEDGAAFKQALGDPQLPDTDTVIPDPQPPYPPCQDVVVEGISNP